MNGSLRYPILLALLLLLMAHESLAQDLGTVAVSGTSNLWGAGHATPPDPGGTGAGSLPPGLAIPAGSGRALQFSNASGTVDFGGCCPPSVPDGEASALITTAIHGGLAGPEINRSHHLAGVFLTDDEPADPAPSALLIDDVSFNEISPQVGQIFFVGDGFTGEGSGASQTFHVPDGATRLFLGYLDCFFPCTVPGGYDDNSGIVSIDVELAGPAAVPLLPGWGLAALVAALLTVSWIRRAGTRRSVPRRPWSGTLPA